VTIKMHCGCPVLKSDMMAVAMLKYWCSFVYQPVLLCSFI